MRPAAFLLLCGLAACGQSGALYLPEDPGVVVSPPSPPPPPAAPASPASPVEAEEDERKAP